MFQKPRSGVIATRWLSLEVDWAATAKMPKAIVERFNKEINNALYDPQREKIFQELHINPKVSTPAKAQGWYLSEIKIWGKVIEKAAIAKQ